MLNLYFTMINLIVVVQGENVDLPTLFDLHQSDYKLKFEFSEIVRYNKQDMQEFTSIAFKYNRTTTAMNSTAIYNFHAGNELEAIIQAYKFASNEYREFPMRFQINLCHALKYNYAGLADANKLGNLSCPVQKGVRYVAYNFVPDGSKLPPLIPSGQFMIEVQELYRDKEMYLVRHYATIYRPIV